MSQPTGVAAGIPVDAGASWEDDGDEFEDFPADDYATKLAQGTVNALAVEDEDEGIVRRSIWVDDWDDEGSEEDFADVLAKNRYDPSLGRKPSAAEKVDPVDQVTAALASATVTTREDPKGSAPNSTGTAAARAASAGANAAGTSSNPTTRRATSANPPKKKSSTSMGAATSTKPRRKNSPGRTGSKMDKSKGRKPSAN